MAAVDSYQGQSAALSAPSDHWVAITPSDTVLLDFIPKALHNRGSAGVVTLTGLDDVDAVFYFAQGATIYVRPKLVKATALGAGVALTALL